MRNMCLYMFCEDRPLEGMNLRAAAKNCCHHAEFGVLPFAKRLVSSLITQPFSLSLSKAMFSPLIFHLFICYGPITVKN